MNRYLATVLLAFSLFFGMTVPAYASSEDTSGANTFSWSSVFSKTFLGLTIAMPAVVFTSLRNKKDD